MRLCARDPQVRGAMKEVAKIFDDLISVIGEQPVVNLKNIKLVQGCQAVFDPHSTVCSRFFTSRLNVFTLALHSLDALARELQASEAVRPKVSRLRTRVDLLREEEWKRHPAATKP